MKSLTLDIEQYVYIPGGFPLPGLMANAMAAFIPSSSSEAMISMMDVLSSALSGTEPE